MPHASIRSKREDPTRRPRRPGHYRGYPEVLVGRAPTVLITAAIVLLPWIALLLLTLGTGTTQARRWGVGWAGIDVMEAVAFLGTAYLVSRRHRLASAAAAAAGALVLVDMWFDCITAPVGQQYGVSLLLALVVELPVTASFFALSWHSSRWR